MIQHLFKKCYICFHKFFFTNVFYFFPCFSPFFFSSFSADLIEQALWKCPEHFAKPQGQHLVPKRNAVQGKGNQATRWPQLMTRRSHGFTRSKLLSFTSCPTLPRRPGARRRNRSLGRENSGALEWPGTRGNAKRIQVGSKCFHLMTYLTMSRTVSTESAFRCQSATESWEIFTSASNVRCTVWVACESRTMTPTDCDRLFLPSSHSCGYIWYFLISPGIVLFSANSTCRKLPTAHCV